MYEILVEFYVEKVLIKRNFTTEGDQIALGSCLKITSFKPMISVKKKNQKVVMIIKFS